MSGKNTQNYWVCGTCTLHNPLTSKNCDACESPKPRRDSHQQVTQQPPNTDQDLALAMELQALEERAAKQEAPKHSQHQHKPHHQHHPHQNASQSTSQPQTQQPQASPVQVEVHSQPVPTPATPLAFENTDPEEPLLPPSESRLLNPANYTQIPAVSSSSSSSSSAPLESQQQQQQARRRSKGSVSSTGAVAVTESSSSLAGDDLLADTPSLVGDAEDSDMVAMMDTMFVQLDPAHPRAQNRGEDEDAVVVLPDNDDADIALPLIETSAAEAAAEDVVPDTNKKLEEHTRSKDDNDDDWEVFDSVDDTGTLPTSAPSNNKSEMMSAQTSSSATTTTTAAAAASSKLTPSSPMSVPTPAQAQSIEWWQAENQKLHHKLALLQQFAKTQLQRTDQLEAELREAKLTIASLGGHVQ